MRSVSRNFRANGRDNTSSSKSEESFGKTKFAFGGRPNSDDFRIFKRIQNLLSRLPKIGVCMNLQLFGLLEKWKIL